MWLQLVPFPTAKENSRRKEHLVRFATLVTLAFVLIAEYPVAAADADQQRVEQIFAAQR
jgi:hypothetical protein